MSKRDTTYDKLERLLFKDADETSVILTESEQNIRLRMMLCVSKKMDTPLIEDIEIVQFLMNGCGGSTPKVSQSQAYRDVAMMNRLVGNITLSAKSWYRYMIVEGAKKAYNMAVAAGDAKGAAACLDKIGKYTMADKDDNRYDYSQMTPPSFEPSDDVTLSGFAAVENLEARRAELRALTAGDYLRKGAEDAQIDEE